jgi:hypothetical protein
VSAPKPRLDVDATRERLLALGCGYAAEQLGHLLSGAVRGEIPPHAFLDRLLAAELSGREERRVRTSLKVSNLPVGQTLENFDFAFQPAIERSRIDTLATCAWVRDGRRDGPAAGPARGGQVAPVRRARGEGRAARLLGAVLPLRRADDGAAGRRRDAAGAAEAADVHVDRAAAGRRARLRADDRQEASLFFRLVSSSSVKNA